MQTSLGIDFWPIIRRKLNESKASAMVCLDLLARCSLLLESQRVDITTAETNVPYAGGTWQTKSVLDLQPRVGVVIAEGTPGYPRWSILVLARCLRAAKR